MARQAESFSAHVSLEWKANSKHSRTSDLDDEETGWHHGFQLGFCCRRPASRRALGRHEPSKELNGQYSHYSVTDITQDMAQGLPRLPDGERLTTMIFLMTQMYRWGVDADTLASRRRLRHSKPSNQKLRSKSGHLKHSSDSQGLRAGVICEPSPKANCWWRGKVGYYASIQSRSVGRRCVCYGPGCYLGILEKDDLSPRQG